jgi:SNF2 family DNA or RNA helicase
MLVVDEAHMLSNDQTLLYKTLQSYDFGRKLLLTGTPLQKDIGELFNVLAFANPQVRIVRLSSRLRCPDARCSATKPSSRRRSAVADLSIWRDRIS